MWQVQKAVKLVAAKITCPPDELREWLECSIAGANYALIQGLKWPRIHRIQLSEGSQLRR